MTFSMPKNGEIYISQVLERCFDLISKKFWEGLSKSSLKTWMNNFKTDEERYFATCCLDSFIYRSEEQTVALMRQLFDVILPNNLFKNLHESNLNINFSHEQLVKSSIDPGFRLIPIMPVGGSQTKSGSLIARLYRRKLFINDQWIISPEKLIKQNFNDKPIIIFIDDFLGTGTQFKSFLKADSLSEKLSEYRLIYSPLVAHTTGISEVLSEFPNIIILPVEVLSDNYSLFSAESYCFNDGVNSSAVARDFYYEFFVKKHPNISNKYIEGFGNLSLAYCFQHAIPNNCLPIIWYRGRDWNPLLER